MSLVSRVIVPPREHITVYAHNFEYGLRFSLDEFVYDVLIGYNISLVQLTPKSMHHIIGFHWVFDFLNFPLDVAIFTDLHEL